MNPFDNIKSIYEKNKLIPESLDDGLCIFLNKWLSFDKNNLNLIYKVLPYLFFVDSLHYFYLLYFIIPKSRPPFLQKPKEEEKDTENPILEKAQQILGYSNKEIQIYKNFFNIAFNKNEAYWKIELGVK